MKEAIKTAFHDAQEARGATFVEEGGWYWSVSFGDPDREYAAVRDELYCAAPAQPARPNATTIKTRMHGLNFFALQVDGRPASRWYRSAPSA